MDRERKRSPIRRRRSNISGIGGPTRIKIEGIEQGGHGEGKVSGEKVQTKGLSNMGTV